MNFRFTKFGLIIALISIPPVAPVLTLFPGVIFATIFGLVTSDCETGYQVVFYLFSISALTCLFAFLFRLKKILSKENSKVKAKFILWCIMIYTFVNTALLIKIVGEYGLCHDGQSLLGSIFSGPLASLAIPVFGFIIDLEIKNQKIHPERKLPEEPE